MVTYTSKEKQKKISKQPTGSEPVFPPSINTIVLLLFDQNIAAIATSREDYALIIERPLPGHGATYDALSLASNNSKF